MENVWTLMVFENGQPQAVVLQYKGRDHAARDRDIMNGETAPKVTVKDDYGRELTFRPMNVQTTLLQDVDRAADGNTIANVKNSVSQAIGQMQAQSELEEHPEVKRMKTKEKLISGMGAFRA